MFTEKSKKFPFDPSSCCICGLTNCQQAIDHEKITINQLKQMVLQNKRDSPQIDNLKLSVRKKFHRLKKQLLQMINNKETTVIRWLDGFYFRHLQDTPKLKNISVLCDIYENDFSKFPLKSLTQTVKGLITQRSKSQTPQPQLPVSSITADLRQLLDSISVPKIIQKINVQIKIDTLKVNEKIKKTNKLSQSTDSVRTSTSTKSQKFQPEASQQLSSYEWKHIRVTQHSKTLQLNNRHITDQDMIQQLPIFSTFHNLKQLQIRNNKITSLTCNLIANQLQFLEILDLRGNKLGDDGMEKVVVKMDKLKALYISETGVGDRIGELLARCLPGLQTLWAEQNKMTGQSCISISQKPKLRLLSLIGNPIAPEDKSLIQSIFVTKGYLNI